MATTPGGTPELLPCPFCGKKALVELTKVRHDQLHGEPYQNTIIRCAARCASFEGGSLEIAAKDWNRRSTPGGQMEKEKEKEGPSASLRGAARLVWSKEKPKVDGKYYHRLPGKGSGVSDIVIIDGEPMSCDDIGELWGFAAECEWAGPIPEPEAEGPAKPEQDSPSPSKGGGDLEAAFREGFALGDEGCNAPDSEAADKAWAKSETRRSIAEGWTGRKCPACKGSGEVDGVNRPERCAACAGTGDEYGPLGGGSHA